MTDDRAMRHARVGSALLLGYWIGSAITKMGWGIYFAMFPTPTAETGAHINQIGMPIGLILLGLGIAGLVRFARIPESKGFAIATIVAMVISFARPYVILEVLFSINTDFRAAGISQCFRIVDGWIGGVMSIGVTVLLVTTLARAARALKLTWSVGLGIGICSLVAVGTTLNIIANALMSQQTLQTVNLFAKHGERYLLSALFVVVLLRMRQTVKAT